jgi:hypothetical protein
MACHTPDYCACLPLPRFVVFLFFMPIDFDISPITFI